MSRSNKCRYFKHYDTETGAPVTAPLDTVEAVSAWCPVGDEASRATAPRPAGRLPPRARTLVCHDMLGGYTDDRFEQGTGSDQCYRFYNWSGVDVFVYFSHHFVTTPPPSWVNAAHNNGVPVLGTLITEWQEGRLKTNQFLADEETRKGFVKQLVAITMYYGFDGWLINIENEVELAQVPSLLSFVGDLRDAMHEALPTALVLWYDSVTLSGKLCWQNQLNAQNKPFFDCSDGIFLNYTWTEEKVNHSAREASAVGRLHDVYLGVDIFGRGCPGGGGYNSCEAVTHGRRADLSVALFAPGWVYEKLGVRDFTQNEKRFWTLLAPLCETHRENRLPLCTTFCQGWGKAFYYCGKQVGGPWTNLALQQLQPRGPIHGLDHNTDDGVCGGGSLWIRASQAETYVTLFTSDTTLDEKIHVTYTIMADCKHFEVALVLDTENPGGGETFVLGPISRVSQTLGERELHAITMVTAAHAGSDETLGREHGKEYLRGGWQTRHYSLNPPEKTQLKCVSLLVRAVDPVSSLTSRQDDESGNLPTPPPLDVGRVTAPDDVVDPCEDYSEARLESGSEMSASGPAMTSSMPSPLGVALGSVRLLREADVTMVPQISGLALTELTREVRSADPNEAEDGLSVFLSLTLTWSCSHPVDYFVVFSRGLSHPDDAWGLVGCTHATAFRINPRRTPEARSVLFRIHPVYHGGKTVPDHLLPTLRVLVDIQTWLDSPEDSQEHPTLSYPPRVDPVHEVASLLCEMK